MSASFSRRVSLCGALGLFLGLTSCLASIEGSWRFASWKVDGAEKGVPAGLTASIQFDGKSGVQGGSGVNQFSAGHAIEGGVVKWTTPFRSTRRAGPPEHMEFEQQFLSILQACDKLAEDATKLTLSGPKGVLVFERQR